MNYLIYRYLTRITYRIPARHENHTANMYIHCKRVCLNPIESLTIIVFTFRVRKAKRGNEISYRIV